MVNYAYHIVILMDVRKTNLRVMKDIYKCRFEINSIFSLLMTEWHEGQHFDVLENLLKISQIVGNM
jgi:hypothetical protein